MLAKASLMCPVLWSHSFLRTNALWPLSRRLRVAKIVALHPDAQANHKEQANVHERDFLSEVDVDTQEKAQGVHNRGAGRREAKDGPCTVVQSTRGHSGCSPQSQRTGPAGMALRADPLKFLKSLP